MFGRKLLFVISSILGSSFGIAESYAPNYMIFLLFRFFLAGCSTSSSISSFCLALEITLAKYRVWVGGLFFMPYAFGYSLLAVVAYWARNWTIMHVTVAIPGLISLIYYWTIDESPRWLMVNGRIEEAKTIIIKATKWNKSHLPVDLDLVEISKTMNNEEGRLKEDQINFFHIFKLTRGRRGRLRFKYGALVTRSFNLFWIWIVNTLVYYGIMLNVSSFSGDRFLNNGLAGLAEIPASLLCIPLLYWGRKAGICSMLISAGISLFLIPWLPEAIENSDEKENFWQTIRLICLIFGKLAITASATLKYTFTAELYPTVIRNSGLAACSCVGRVGSILAPYLSGISKVNKNVTYVPMIIFGVCAFSAGLLTLLLPETKGKKLPDLLENATIFEQELKMATVEEDPLMYVSEPST